MKKYSVEFFLRAPRNGHGRARYWTIEIDAVDEHDARIRACNHKLNQVEIVSIKEKK